MVVVAIEPPAAGWITVGDDDGYKALLTISEWRAVLRLPTGKQRAAVERIVDQREENEE